MPSSRLDAIEIVLQLVIDLNPKSVLDLGVGFGKWGFLCREYLETGRNGVYAQSDWKVRIDGIEIFRPYIGEHQGAIYNNIYIQNLDSLAAREWIAGTKYQLYLAMDVIEHIRDWRALLQSIPEGRPLVVVVPNGPSAQGMVMGNPHEEHVYTFVKNDLISFFDTVETVKSKLVCVRNVKR